MTQTKDSTTGEREEIARIIGDNFSPNLTFDKSSAATQSACYRAANAILSRMAASSDQCAEAGKMMAASSEGWVLVPPEPTPEMFGAGGVQAFKDDMAGTPVREAVGNQYRAMLAARPDAGAVAVPVSEEMVEAAHAIIWPATEWDGDEHGCRETVRAALTAALAVPDTGVQG